MRVGDRKPLAALPLTDGGDAGIIGCERRVDRRDGESGIIGCELRVDRRGGEAGIIGCERRVDRRGRAELSGVASDPMLSSGASIFPCRRSADRVVGARYPSRASDSPGGMTWGVAGTALDEADILPERTANRGSADVQTRPEDGLVQVSALSQARLPQKIGDLSDWGIMAVSGVVDSSAIL